MTPQEYIKQERAKGTSEIDISNGLKTLNQNTERSFSGEIIPTITSTAGAIGGGILGIPAGPAGVVAGGVAGATLGGAAGEGIQQGVEQVFGDRKGLNFEQAAAQGIKSGATELVFGPLGVAGGALKKPLVSFISKASGYADNVIEKALTRSPEVVSGAKQGEQFLSDVTLKTIKSVQQLAKQTLKETQEKITTLETLFQAKNTPQVFSSIKNGATQMVTKIEESLPNSGIFIENTAKGKKLIFDSLEKSSNIVSSTDKKVIYEALNSVSSIAKNPTIKNIDSILEKLVTLQKTPSKSGPTGPEAKAIVGKIIDDVTAFVEETGKMNPIFKEYATFIKENIVKRSDIKDLKSIFGSKENPTAQELSRIQKRIINMWNFGEKPTRDLIENKGKDLAGDISGASAGAIIKETGKGEIGGTAAGSVQTAKTSILNVIPRKVLENYVKTGNLTGEWAGKTLDILFPTLRQSLTQEFLNKNEK